MNTGRCITFAILAGVLAGTACRAGEGPAAAAIEKLNRRLTDRNVNVRRRAAEDAETALKEIRVTAVMLTSLLQRDDPVIRLEAAKALAELGPGAYQNVFHLGKALSDKEEGVRAYAAVALGRIGPLARDAVPALAAALKDKSALVRGRAAVALGLIGPAAKVAVPALREALSDPDRGLPGDVSVKDAAAHALKQIQGGE